MAFLFAAEQAQRASDRALHFHGGYGFMEEYDIQLFYRRAKGWANVLDEPGTRVRAPRRPAVRTGRDAPARADVDFTPSPAAEQFGEEVRELVARTYTDERRQHAHDTGTMHDWELHRAMADQGWIRQALPEALGRRRTRPRGAGGAVPRARARRRALRRHEHLHDGGVGARARGQRHAAARDPAQAAERRVADRARVLGTRRGLRRRRRPHARGARRRRLAHRRAEDLHQPGRGVGVGVPPHPHQPRRAQAPRPHVLPRADVGTGLRAAAHPHAVGQAHQHDLLRRRARRRRVARRRRRRRLAGDAGRAVVRARRRRWGARRRAAARASPRRTRATRSTTTAVR